MLGHSKLECLSLSTYYKNDKKFYPLTSAIKYLNSLMWKHSKLACLFFSGKLFTKILKLLSNENHTIYIIFQKMYLFIDVLA
jgi:hypothetical protein